LNSGAKAGADASRKVGKMKAHDRGGRAL
jgi:hypothetical protein